MTDKKVQKKKVQKEKALEVEVAPLGYVTGTPIPRTRKKVCIVGFAPSTMRDVVHHFDDPDCEIWAINQLYVAFPEIVPHVTRWFQIHHRHSYDQTVTRDHSHHKWLGEQTLFPIYMQKQQPDVPSSVEFPKDLIMSEFGNYFTNSISWEIALAIHEGFEDIYMYGVEMATDSEYQYERPSVEYFIGIAKGRGIRFHVPEASDILKTMWLYPYEDSAPMRTKIESRRKELRARVNELNAQIQHFTQQRDGLHGALENMMYIQKCWVETSRELEVGKGF